MVGSIYSDVTELEGKYSFIYFIIFFLLTSIFFALLSKTMMKRLEEINNSVKKISSGNLGVHIPVVKNDEIGELAANINRMVNRLKESIENEKNYKK